VRVRAEEHAQAPRAQATGRGVGHVLVHRVPSSVAQPRVVEDHLRPDAHRARSDDEPHGRVQAHGHAGQSNGLRPEPACVEEGLFELEHGLAGPDPEGQAQPHRTRPEHGPGRLQHRLAPRQRDAVLRAVDGAAARDDARQRERRPHRELVTRPRCAGAFRGRRRGRSRRSGSGLLGLCRARHTVDFVGRIGWVGQSQPLRVNQGRGTRRGPQQERQHSEPERALDTTPWGTAWMRWDCDGLSSHRRASPRASGARRSGTLQPACRQRVPAGGQRVLAGSGRERAGRPRPASATRHSVRARHTPVPQRHDAGAALTALLLRAVPRETGTQGTRVSVVPASAPRRPAHGS
jgi:hypothetical protein